MRERIAKHVYDDNWMLEKSTYYILDAQGNQLSMYEHEVDQQDVNYTLTERNIYGSSRLGRNSHKIDMLSSTPNYDITYVAGEKFYELTNHLGNVLTVISDIKYPVEDNGYVDYFEVQLVSVSDYSGFGVQLDGRTNQSDSYRYWFQGQEMDDEVKGEGNSVNYKYRMHDARVGRFFAVDPLAASYPYYTPYSFSGNKVIHAIELEGLEEFLLSDNREGTTQLFFFTQTKYPNTIGKVVKNNGNLTMVSRSLTLSERQIDEIKRVLNLSQQDRKSSDYGRAGLANSLTANQNIIYNPVEDKNYGQKTPRNLDQFEPINMTSTTVQSNFGNSGDGRLNFNVPIAGGAESFTMKINKSMHPNTFNITDNFGNDISINSDDNNSFTGVLSGNVRSINILISGRLNDPADAVYFSVSSFGPDEKAINIPTSNAIVGAQNSDLFYQSVKTTGVTVKNINSGSPVNE
ncbi:MAG: hypothetical protein JJT77_12290 [Crocinitomicaceae bacterium]|nr:hypothetical protein [Crocinitomicaceae bacterium]